MNFLLAGSLAYDTILIHSGEFHHKILPEEISRLNVAFGIQSVSEQFGGTAGNIAYNSALLNNYPMMISCVGKENFQKYATHLANCNIYLNHLTIIEKEKMAQAWLMTDKTNNQIIGFYPGAMIHKPIIPENTPNLWHLSPDYTHNMLFLAKQATVLNKKYFLDPGQDIVNLLNYIDTQPSVDSCSFREAISNASGLFVNEYEGLLIKNKLGLDNFYTELFNNTKLEFIVETLGSKGSLLILKDNHKIFHVTKADKIVDPTGCGDSFRAGFISEYLKSGNLEKSVQLGTVLASFAIEHFGGQNHKPTLKDITKRLIIS